MTEFARLLQASPDVYTFLSSRGPFTVFVPTDSAFDKLKPGGLLIIIDHAALPGSPVVATANTLHRIDPAAVKAEVEGAGFVFDGESTVLRNPADPHTKIVFDPSIRGKTDQFMFRFKKP